VQTFESLRSEGHIRRWGVSNFEVADMEDLFRIRGGEACATNQVVYNLADRRSERGLLAWCEDHGLPIMAYSPLGRGGDLLRNAGLGRVVTTASEQPRRCRSRLDYPQRARDRHSGVRVAGSRARECVCPVSAADGSGCG